MIWVYGIAEQSDRPPPFEAVPAGALVAVVAHRDDPPQPTPDAFWDHEHAVEQAMADRAVLPARFGTTAPSESALRKALLERHDELTAALDLVRGRVELAVRVVANDTPAVAAGAPSSGREWLGARLDAARRADAVHEPLAALAAAARRRPAQGDVLRAAYLVDRDVVPDFEAAVQRLQRDDLAILCTGPWPPYSFVDGAAP